MIPNVSYGDRDVALKNEILRTVVGSGVHGIAIEGTDDHDEMGIFIEPPEHVVGLAGPYDQHVWRTQPEGARSGPGDTDLTIYSLRKYLRLAMQGNPTSLIPLFASRADVLVETDLGVGLRALTSEIISRSAGRRFLGYLDDQRERMLGRGKQARVPNRPELVEAFGYDVKYASHAVRLAHQGLELMQTGRLSLPMREDERRWCLQVKRGEWTMEQVLVHISRIEASLMSAIEDSTLPEQPNYALVGEFSIYAHQEHWARTQ